MTETQLTNLVAEGESERLEFKKTTAEREAAMKTLARVSEVFAGAGSFHAAMGKAAPYGGSFRRIARRRHKSMTNDSQQIVTKAWNFAHVLRDDGLS